MLYSAKHLSTNACELVIFTQQMLIAEHKISKADVYKVLIDKLATAEKSKGIDTRNNTLKAFINLVDAQKGKAITKATADLLITDAKWAIAQ